MPVEILNNPLGLELGVYVDINPSMPRVPFRNGPRRPDSRLTAVLTGLPIVVQTQPEWVHRGALNYARSAR